MWQDLNLAVSFTRFGSKLLTQPISRIHTALKRFKDFCHPQGWKAGDDGDWFKVDEAYHVFIWSKSIPLATLKSMVSRRRLSVREADRWAVREVSRVAFITEEGFSDEILNYVLGEPELLSVAVLYDLNRYEKIGEAPSPVFSEFERFLKEKYEIELKPLKILTRK